MSRTSTAIGLLMLLTAAVTCSPISELQGTETSLLHQVGRYLSGTDSTIDTAVVTSSVNGLLSTGQVAVNHATGDATGFSALRSLNIYRHTTGSSART